MRSFHAPNDNRVCFKASQLCITQCYNIVHHEFNHCVPLDQHVCSLGFILKELCREDGSFNKTL